VLQLLDTSRRAPCSSGVSSWGGLCIITVTNGIQWVLSDMQNMAFGPYLADINRILSSLVYPVGGVDHFQEEFDRPELAVKVYLCRRASTISRRSSTV
jgi:hypothetical protein